MFSDWEDPYDIDTQYDEVSKVFQFIKPYAPPMELVTTNESQGTQDTQIAANPSPVTAKNNFEIRPNTYLPDGGSTGMQPKYNILQSGPPAIPEAIIPNMPKQSFGNREYRPCRSDMSWIYFIILWFIVIYLLATLISVRAELKFSNKMMMCMMLEHMKKSKN